MEKSLLITLNKEIVISAKDAAEILGSRQAVYRLAEKGELQHVYPKGLGYFTLPGVEEGEAHFAIVVKYYPDCIISGPTALSLYGLANEYIGEIDVDISNLSNLSNKLLNVHRVHPDKIVGDVFTSFEDRGVSFKVRVYGLERVLHEAYKYYYGTDSFYRALKRYRKMYLNTQSPGKQYDEILKYDKKVGMILVNFLQMGDVSE